MPLNQHRNVWILRGGESLRLSPFALMGIVNISPDSFYDNGRYARPLDGLNHAMALWQEGAHILDIGAESTRPGAVPVDADLEIERLMPALTPLMDNLAKAKSTTKSEQNIPYISVDTYHAKTAQVALEAGVHIINDISACTFDPELLEVVAHYKPGYVLMHSTDRPQVMQQNIMHDNVVDNIRLFFELQINRLVKAGLPESHIVLDLGIGFGKSFEQNIELLNNIASFKQFGLPVLMAVSMKSFLTRLIQCSDDNVSERAKATQLVTSLLAMQGICLHRVHHVADTLRTLNIVQNFR